MNKHHPHNDIIEKKLEQLPGADADSLWNDMHSILDKKMPQKKERRRVIAWFHFSKPFLLLLVGFIIGAASSLFFLSGKKSATNTITELPVTSTPNEFSKDGVTKIHKPVKENTTITGEPDKKGGIEISTTTASAIAADRVINNSFIGLQREKKSNDYVTELRYNEPAQIMTGARPDLVITPVNLKSGYEDNLITGNVNEQTNSLTLRLLTPPADAHTNTGRNNETGFYAGIMTGLDLSFVHFRSARAGSTKGFIVGYAFNKKWGIESGLLWDTKRVFDNGNHFTPPGYTPSSGITIIAVNGKSRLYEWPVNVKYTILSGKHHLFTTAGLSSYLMRSENYEYEYWQNNQPGGHNYLNYKNETKNWFGVVNLSMGYSHRLGSIGSFRVEPYLKLPIKTLGVGKMPITSTGLNIGFTKMVR